MKKEIPANPYKCKPIYHFSWCSTVREYRIFTLCSRCLFIIWVWRKTSHHNTLYISMWALLFCPRTFSTFLLNLYFWKSILSNCDKLLPECQRTYYPEVTSVFSKYILYGTSWIYSLYFCNLEKNKQGGGSAKQLDYSQEGSSLFLKTF